MPLGRTNELLGYPSDARLLIINADDFGVFQPMNEAIFRTLKEGVARSTTLMVPCPGAPAAMQILKENPDFSFGVHITLVRDVTTYQWVPIAPKEEVLSLIDETGHFYNYDRIPELLEVAVLDEVEIESRTQIERVLSAGLKPTHLDWHCLFDGGRKDIFDMTVRLAKEYGLAIRVGSRANADNLQREGFPTNDHMFLDSYRLETVGKTAQFVNLLRVLPVGLSEWAVHPGLATPEAQEIDPSGWPIRHADYEFLISQEAKDTIRDEEIILLDYGALQKVWRENTLRA
jgi:chitin disaccharide deacetylase